MAELGVNSTSKIEVTKRRVQPPAYRRARQSTRPGRSARNSNAQKHELRSPIFKSQFSSETFANLLYWLESRVICFRSSYKPTVEMVYSIFTPCQLHHLPPRVLALEGSIHENFHV
ncbi:hypothetical protein Y032_0084g1779 [Ancylostoma ceylanicum]|uniref:Uncharacterized protein n=1 Tax=Ancylostoma ceylanicum TaxID=53326 RepID=A0A016TQV9_9BILA|nr:hypothetical protein Y032_0084g1779 [Ancylostoma ceylanicum]